MTTPAIAVEQWDLRTSSEAQLRDLHAFADVMAAETHPQDPGRLFDEFAASVRSMPDTYEVFAFVTRDTSGRVTGWAEGAVVRAPENAHMAEVTIDVRPDARRGGIGRALLAHLVDFAVSRGRTMVIGATNDRVPAGEAFARHLGLDPVLVSHANRLVLADLDPVLLDRWISEGPERAPGYSLLAVDGPYPDDLVTDVVVVLDAMNDAPRGDVQMDDEHVTVGFLREQEQQMAATGSERWSIFARHDASARIVGLTDVRMNPSIPETVGQGSTGVVADHRGHALGKWMKATMLRRILDQRPGCKDVRTSNAASNAAMVGINTELGFKPHNAVMTWQVPVARLRAYLA